MPKKKQFVIIRDFVQYLLSRRRFIAALFVARRRPRSKDRTWLRYKTRRWRFSFHALVWTGEISERYAPNSSRAVCCATASAAKEWGRERALRFETVLYTMNRQVSRHQRAHASDAAATIDSNPLIESQEESLAEKEERSDARRRWGA